MPAIQWLAVSLILINPALAEEPDPETVAVPKVLFLRLVEDYKAQKAANVLLWERQEEVNKRLDKWQIATGCT